MSDTAKSILFALVLCVVCGLMLTAAATGLQDIQERNMRNDRRKNILYSVDLISRDKNYTPEEISTIYEDHIQKHAITQSGAIVDPEAVKGGQQLLPLYLYTTGDRIEAYIVPIESQGLWGKIFAYLALEADGSTVAGFTVYQHSETPGLGGEIEKRWFQKNFKGKQIVDKSGNFVAIQIAKGDVDKQVPESKESHYVDGISGATLTGKYLSEGLAKTLSQYEPVSVAFRKNRLRCRLQQAEPWCEPDEVDPN